MGEKRTKIDISESTHAKLQHISRLTSIPMSKIISDITDCMMSLVVGNYPKATFKVMDMVTEDSVIITIHTYGQKQFAFGSFKTDNTMTEEQIDKRISEETKKALGDA